MGCFFKTIDEVRQQERATKQRHDAHNAKITAINQISASETESDENKKLAALAITEFIHQHPKLSVQNNNLSDESEAFVQQLDQLLKSYNNESIEKIYNILIDYHMKEFRAPFLSPSLLTHLVLPLVIHAASECVGCLGMLTGAYFLPAGGPVGSAAAAAAAAAFTKLMIISLGIVPAILTTVVLAALATCTYLTYQLASKMEHARITTGKNSLATTFKDSASWLFNESKTMLGKIETPALQALHTKVESIKSSMQKKPEKQPQEPTSSWRSCFSFG